MFEFLEGMFENIGSKLKKFAKILFVVAILSSLICAFSFGIEKSHYDRYTGRTQYEFTALFWIFLLISPIVSYMQSALIYGFGELIEKATETKQLMEKVVNNDVVTPEEKEEKEIEDALKF